MSNTLCKLSLFIFSLVLFGCAANDADLVSYSDFVQETKGFSKAGAVHLTVGDVIELSVEVDGQMEVSGYRAEVNYDGMITLPLVGDIKVNMLKLDETRAVIDRAYSKYYVNPPVIMLSTVGDADKNEWGGVTVTGQVKQPGVVHLTSSAGIKLTVAIQKSGGFAPAAKRNGIRVSRVDGSGRKMQVMVNYDEIGKKGDSSADLNLVAGDIVYVPERIF